MCCLYAIHRRASDAKDPSPFAATLFHPRYSSQSYPLSNSNQLWNKKNTVDAHAFNRMIRHRNDLQVERRRLQYELDVISSQLEEANRRLRDLECAAKAPVSTSSSNSGWDRNTHDLFIKNLRNSFSTIYELMFNSLKVIHSLITTYALIDIKRPEFQQPEGRLQPT